MRGSPGCKPHVLCYDMGPCVLLLSPVQRVPPGPQGSLQLGPGGKTKLATSVLVVLSVQIRGSQSNAHWDRVGDMKE